MYIQILSKDETNAIKSLAGKGGAVVIMGTQYSSAKSMKSSILKYLKTRRKQSYKNEKKTCTQHFSTFKDKEKESVTEFE